MGIEAIYSQLVEKKTTHLLIILYSKPYSSQISWENYLKYQATKDFFFIGFC